MTEVAAERAASAASAAPTASHHAPPPPLPVPSPSRSPSSSPPPSSPPPDLSTRQSPAPSDARLQPLHAPHSQAPREREHQRGDHARVEELVLSTRVASPLSDAVPHATHELDSDTELPRVKRDVTPDAHGSPSAHGDEKRSEQLDAPRSDASFDDPFAQLDVVSTMDLFDVSNYTFGIKNDHCRCKLMLASSSKSDLYQHLRTTYNKRGIRRSVGAVILVHNHRFPHILLLQRKDGRGEYVLPGGRLRPGESNEDGLQRKLLSKLTPSDVAAQQHHDPDDHSARPDVGEKLCSWYAIDFDRRYFPYVPAHVTKPKEELHIYAVSLPSKFTFAVPNNLQLLAVPIFDVFNNSATYGDVISSIPSVLSKYHFNYC